MFIVHLAHHAADIAGLYARALGHLTSRSQLFGHLRGLINGRYG